MYKLFLIALLFSWGNIWAQTPMKMLLNKKKGNAYILDAFPNASVAYSLRKLSSSYSGPCLQVWYNGPGGSTPTDIGFTSSGFLDTAALKAFVGPYNGYVYKWYDQSGNGVDAIDSSGTNSSGELIDSLGTLVKMNGVVAIKQDQSLKVMNMTTSVTFVSCFAVVKVDAAKTVNVLLANETAAGGPYETYLYGTAIGGALFGGYDGVNTRSSSNTLSRNLLYWNIVSSAIYFSKNGSSVTGGGAFASSMPINKIFGRSINNLNMSGRIQEIIVYPFEQSVNKPFIESNINSFWSIY